jgi:hypothetical protein
MMMIRTIETLLTVINNNNNVDVNNNDNNSNYKNNRGVILPTMRITEPFLRR